MSEHTILNNIDHADLGYDKDNLNHTEYHSMCSPILIEEIDILQCEYPIFFLNNKNGLGPVVLCGFEQGENLFIQGQEWQSAFRPLYTKKGPFFISMNPDSGQAAIAVDLNDSRISNDITPKIFTDRGGNSSDLNEIKDTLEKFGDGIPRAKAFTKILEENQLLEPFRLEVTLTSDKKAAVSGLYTINEEKLSSLNDDVLLALHRNGMMKKIHFIMGSVNNVRKLMNAKMKKEGLL